ncbi:MAG: tRNA (adenosine(37)-N6)-dimethylallyltransferase MiaA [Pseudomonadota bacterium]
MPNAIVIAGPTASGKSSLAIELAEVLGGEIINADAMQVYGEVRILTARPSEADEMAVPHHLYGVASGADAWSAGRFARAAATAAEEVAGRGRLPLIVGGTGLWLKALTQGLSPMPNVPLEVVNEARERLSSLGLEVLREEVLAADPAMSSLKPNDIQRHLRAWSVHRATGKPLSEWQALPLQLVTALSFEGYVLAPLREALYRQCNVRFNQMIEEGALDEVRTLLGLSLSAHLPLMKAVGVPELAAFLAGKHSLEEAKAAAQQSTRRLAKRQMTWFRGQAPHWPRYETSQAAYDAIIGGGEH